MTIIKGLDKLSEILGAEDLEKLDAAASIHQKQSNIAFTIVGLEEQTITVETEQGKTSGNYANFRTLTKRTNEVFGKMLPSGYSLDVIPIEYAESPATAVTPEWINRKMLEKGVRIKQIAFDTGIDRKDISGWVTGERSMSQIVKAMFYFYFNSR